jgi:inosine-uridine nucleoside N-ribohydrolase
MPPCRPASRYDGSLLAREAAMHLSACVRSLILTPVALALAVPALAQAPAIEKTPILLDTDAGSDVDDAFALALILASPELDLRGVTTVGSDPQTRALLLCRFLTMTGRRHVQVAAGSEPQPKRPIRGQYQYYYHPDVLFNRTTRPVESAVEFLHGRLKAQPGKITLVAAGPLTNIARLLEQKPDAKAWIKRIIVPGGALAPAADVRAAQTVFASGIPLWVIPGDLTSQLKLSNSELAQVFAPGTALSLQVQALYQLADEPPMLGDALLVALCVEDRFCTWEERALRVGADGRLIPSTDGKLNARVATGVHAEGFRRWYAERMASCVAPAKRPAALVEQGRFPHRVHVAEDYDTDIERRWWMAGKAEMKNLPPGSARACRGVLTHDFDDLLGHSRAMYTAVVFNPVPGPPMGKNTRLSFRYWLHGTASLRVQIYSLTNGYHRHLVLTGLPQDRWQSATVDMTKARRPDGTGGPLSEGERIDDIQFYADPTAELVIDDIVLYDAASASERRPFPKRILFTAGFDSGKQGKEWPGSFEIVPQKGYFWHAAKSVANPDTGLPWIRLGLRGDRSVGDATSLRFRYRVTGADAVQIVLGNHTTKTAHEVTLKGLAQDTWSEATVSFSEAAPRSPARGDLVDEIQWRLPQGAELLVDDVVLFEPE